MPGPTVGLRYSEAVIQADRRPLLHDVEHEAGVAVVDGQPAIGEQHGEFASWLERHRPNDLRSRTPPPQSLPGAAPLPPAGARTVP